MKKLKVLSKNDRTRSINKVSLVDTFANLFIGIIKVVIALTTGSVTLASDAVINFGDTVSGIITISGIHLSEHKPTEKHPFGFGRIEYLTTIIVSTVMILVGGELARISVEHIINRVEIHIYTAQIILLFLMVFVKFFLYFYNKKVSQRTENETIEGVAHDSLISAFGNLLIVTLVFIDRFVNIPLDGWISLGIATFIILSNIIDILKTINLMLGTKPDAELIQKIRETALEMAPIENVKNIIIHSYGYFVHYGQMDVELPDDMDVRTASIILRNLQTELKDKYEIEFTFGLWPENIKYKNTIHQFRATDKGVTVCKNVQKTATI